ncbi:MAG TPA: flippase [Candidatus Nanoarchaeia archaeon]|nr:flippase [Candidatus Nanoarchaeia archaeon]
MNYTKRVVAGLGIVFLMRALGSLFAYLIRLVLARELTPTEYGLFYAVLTMVIFFIFFRDLGLGQALVKYIPEFQVHKKFDRIKTAIVSVCSFQFLSSLILCAAFFFAADYLALNYFKNPDAAVLLKLFIPYILLSIFFIIQKSILQGFQRIAIFSTIEFVKNVGVFFILLLFLGQGLGVFAPVLAYVATAFLLILIYIAPTYHTFNLNKYQIVNLKPITKQMFAFGVPVMFTTVGDNIISYIDTLMLTYYTTLENVGIYNVVLPSAVILITLGTSIAAVLYPLTSELWARKDTKRLTDGLRILHRYSFVAIIPIIFTIFAFSQFFIEFFFGPEYVAGTRALQILLLGVLVFIVAVINHNILAGIGRPRDVTKIIFTAALVNTIVNFLLIPLDYTLFGLQIGGINGAAIATSLSYLVALIYSMKLIRRHINVHFPFKDWGKLLIAAAAFIAVLAFVKEVISIATWMEIVVSAGIAGIVYLLVVFLLHIIDISEIKYYLKHAR